MYAVHISMLLRKEKEVIIMKISVELDMNERDSLKKMLRAALKAAKNAGLDMDISVSKQVDSVDNLFAHGPLNKQLDSFVVWTAIDGLTAMIDQFGTWIIQTIRMIKGLGRIANKYDKRIKKYLEYTKNMND